MRLRRLVSKGSMNDRDIGKREIEREHLDVFLDAYARATGETFPEMWDSETPDFIGRDDRGRVVGIELTQLRFGPDDRHMHNIFPQEPFELGLMVAASRTDA